MDERLKRVMAETFEVDAERIDTHTAPDTLTAWDSLRHMSLILALEREFGIEFDEEEIPELSSYELLREAIAAKLATT